MQASELVAKSISTDAPHIVAGRVAGTAVWGADNAPLFGDIVPTPAPPKRRSQKLFFFLQYSETTYQSHFFHTIFNNSYNHTNST
jgi:hypothetical protein